MSEEDWKLRYKVLRQMYLDDCKNGKTKEDIDSATYDRMVIS